MKKAHDKLVLLPLGMLLAAAIASGCRREREVVPPSTYPVNGKIVAKGANMPSGCLIQFEPKDAKCMAQGIIQPDGTFKLTTRYEGVVCDGAAEGEYQVTIIPPISADAPMAKSVRLPKPVQIKPETNELTIPFNG